MTALVRRGLHGLRYTLFAASSLLVAAYAFAFLRMRPFDPHDPFMVKFAVSGIDVPMHFFGAGLALLLVPLQASDRIRRRWPALHRTGGWLYAGGVLVGGLGGFSLAFDAHGGWAAGAGFLLLSVLWLAVTANGIRLAVVRDFDRHRRWMCHSLAMTFAAVTLRAILFVGTGPLGLPFDGVYIFSAWASWSLNIAVCAWWLSRGRRTAVARLRHPGGSRGSNTATAVSASPDDPAPRAAPARRWASPRFRA